MLLEDVKLHRLSGKDSVELLPEFLTVSLMRECENCIAFCRIETALSKLHRRTEKVKLHCSQNFAPAR